MQAVLQEPAKDTFILNVTGPDFTETFCKTHLHYLDIIQVKAHTDLSGSSSIFVKLLKPVRESAWRGSVKEYNQNASAHCQIKWAGNHYGEHICVGNTLHRLKSTRAYKQIMAARGTDAYYEWPTSSPAASPLNVLCTPLAAAHSETPATSNKALPCETQGKVVFVEDDPKAAQGGASFSQSVEEEPDVDKTLDGKKMLVIEKSQPCSKVGDKRKAMVESFEMQLQLVHLTKKQEYDAKKQQAEKQQPEENQECMSKEEGKTSTYKQAEQQRNTILKIRNCSEAVMSELQNKGLSEKCHEKALSIALNKAGLCHRTQVECHEEFMGEPLTTLYADLVVEDVVVELKVTAHTETKKWTEQVQRYMSSLSKLGEKKYVGLIVNFNKGTGKVDFTEVGPECPAASSAWVGRMWEWASQSLGAH